MQWAYGITTIPERFDLFQRTLESLKRGGFDQPQVFVDGCRQDARYEGLGLSITYRYPRIRTAGNWWLGLLELYLRNAAPRPNEGLGVADRYAMFQDDFICSANFREYLERSTTNEKCYWNCYTFPENTTLPGAKPGWYESNQLGKGAVALVFSTLGVQTLLMSYHWVHRPLDYRRGFRAIDGGIVDSFRKAGWKELVHQPSLIQHMGDETSIEVIAGDARHPKQPKSPTFMGEEFDLLMLPVHPIENIYPTDEAWKQEEEALERAIREDELRLREATTVRERSLLSGHIARYQRNLVQHRRNRATR